ncbi:MAG: hypothetical protein DI539_01450 [Flavobacterium psychrophilum]|nr:MAG: hypothetical protein DI539_01450 [Flavobacterium psychrophilum]
MSQNFYKQVAISQLIVSGWILFAFFDYLMNDKDVFRGLGLLTLFIYSSMWVSGIGLLLVIVRLSWFRKSYKDFLSKKFIYVLTGVFNAYLVVIWIISFGLNQMNLSYFSFGLFLVSLISAVIILKDFYNPKTEKISDVVIETVE